MHAISSQFRRTVPVVALLLLTAVAGFAKDGRDFAGFYSLSNVSELGTTVQFTLTLRLTNYSSGDAQQAVVTLYETGAGATPHGAFQPIVLFRKRQQVRLSQQFTVPKYEYQRWEHGLNPTLMVAFVDPNGKNMRRGVQLVRRPAPRG